MKRLLVAALFTSLLCLPALAQKKTGPDFNRMIQDYYAKWSTLNPDNPAPLYAKGPDLVFFDVDLLNCSTDFCVDLLRSEIYR